MEVRCGGKRTGELRLAADRRDAVLTRLSEAPRSISILHFMLLASGLLGIRILLRLRTNFEICKTNATKNRTRHHHRSVTTRLVLLQND
jgi:hypothetical protein